MCRLRRLEAPDGSRGGGGGGLIWINPRGDDWIFQRGGGSTHARQRRETGRNAQHREATVLFVQGGREGGGVTRHLLLLLILLCCAPTDELALSGVT